MDEEIHYPTRPVDKDKAEHELVINIKKATSPEETAPKQKHVRSMSGTFRWCAQIADPSGRRMYHVYLGLPLFNIFLERSASATHFGR